MKTRPWKRILSLLLTAALCMGLLPAAVFAGADVPEAFIYDLNRQNEYSSPMTDGYLEQDVDGAVCLSLSGGVPGEATIQAVYLVTNNSSHTRMGTIFENSAPPAGASGGLEGTNGIWVQNVKLTLPVGTYLTEFVTDRGSMLSEDYTDEYISISGTVEVVSHGSAPNSGPVAAPPAITISALPGGFTGIAYTATLTATPAQESSVLAWSGNGIPDWLTLSTGGVLSGTPTRAGRWSFTVTVTETGAATRSTSGTFTLTVKNRPSYSIDPNNGSAGTTATVDPDTQITLPEAPSYPGHGFRYWQSGDENYNPGDSVVIDRDKYFYAVWDSYTLTVQMPADSPKVIGQVTLKGVTGSGEEAIGWQHYRVPTALTGDNAIKVYTPSIANKGYTGLKLYATVDGVETVIGQIEGTVPVNEDATLTLNQNGTWYLLDEKNTASTPHTDSLTVTDGTTRIDPQNYYASVYVNDKYLSRPCLVSGTGTYTVALSHHWTWNSDFDANDWVWGTYDATLTTNASDHSVSIEVRPTHFTRSATLSGTVAINGTPVSGAKVYVSQTVNNCSRSFSAITNENGEYTLPVYPGSKVTAYAYDNVTYRGTARVTTSGNMVEGNNTLNLSDRIPRVQTVLTVNPSGTDEAIVNRYLNQLYNGSVNVRFPSDWDWVGHDKDTLRYSREITAGGVSSDAKNVPYSVTSSHFEPVNGTLDLTGFSGEIENSLTLRPGVVVPLRFEDYGSYYLCWFDSSGTCVGFYENSVGSYPNSAVDFAVPGPVRRTPGQGEDGYISETVEHLTGNMTLALVPDAYRSRIVPGSSTISGKTITTDGNAYSDMVLNTWQMTLTKGKIELLDEFTVTTAASEDAAYVTRPNSTMRADRTDFSSTNDLIRFSGSIGLDAGITGGKLKQLNIDLGGSSYNFTASMVELTVDGVKYTAEQSGNWGDKYYRVKFNTPLELPVDCTPANLSWDVEVSMTAEVEYDDAANSWSSGKSSSGGQLIGRAVVTKPGTILSLLSPYVSNDTVRVRGVAGRYETVQLYDGAVHTATVRANHWGEWEADVPLVGTDSVLATEHELTAVRLDSAGNPAGTSAPSLVIHQPGGAELTKFTMAWNDGSNREIDMGGSYTFRGWMKDIRFKAVFTNSEKLTPLQGFGCKVVFRVNTADGEIRYLEATESNGTFEAALDTMLGSGITSVHCLFEPVLVSGFRYDEESDTGYYTAHDNTQSRVDQFLGEKLFAGTEWESDVGNQTVGDMLTALRGMDRTSANDIRISFNADGNPSYNRALKEDETEIELTETAALLEQYGMALCSMETQYTRENWTYEWLGEIAQAQIDTPAEQREGKSYTASIYFDTANEMHIDRLILDALETPYKTHTAMEAKQANGPFTHSYSYSDGVRDDSGQLTGETYYIAVNYCAYPAVNLYSMTATVVLGKDFNGCGATSWDVPDLSAYTTQFSSQIANASLQSESAASASQSSSGVMLMKAENRRSSSSAESNSGGIQLMWNGDYDLGYDASIGYSPNWYHGNAPIPSGSCHFLGLELGLDYNVDNVSALEANAGTVMDLIGKGDLKTAAGIIGNWAAAINIFSSVATLNNQYDRFSRMEIDLLNLKRTKCARSLYITDRERLEKIFDEFKATQIKAYEISQAAWATGNALTISGLWAGSALGKIMTKPVATGGAIKGIQAALKSPVGIIAMSILIAGMVEVLLAMDEVVNAERMVAQAYNAAYAEMCAIMNRENTELCKKDKKQREADMRQTIGSSEKLVPDAGSTTPNSMGHDPAGVVYEAVIENPIQDATVKLYYAVDANGEPVREADTKGVPATTVAALREADDVRGLIPRQSTQSTGEDGRYQWGVPEGLWYVTAEKEGYQSGSSNADNAATVQNVSVTGNAYNLLPVLPVQLDVNIPLVDYSAPTVEEVKYTRDGVYITFSKYMVDTEGAENSVLNSANYLLLTAQGTPLSGLEVSPEVQGHTPENLGAAHTYTRTVKLTSPELSSTSSVSLVVRGRVESYAGTSMGSDYLPASSPVAEMEQLAAPALRIGEETVTSAQMTVERGTVVSIAAADGADIYYTADGSTPTSESQRFSAPVAVANNMTLKAIAVKAGYANSPVASCAFTVASTLNHQIVVTVNTADGETLTDGVGAVLSGNGVTQTAAVADGAVSFSGLSVGTYTLTLSGNGFAGITQEITVSPTAERVSVTVTMRADTSGNNNPAPSGGGGTGSNTLSIPVSSEAGAMTLSVKVSGSTATVRTLSDSDIRNVVSAEQEQIDVLFDLSGLNDIGTVSIPAESFVKVVEALSEHDGNDTIIIRTDTGEVQLDEATIQCIAEQAAGGSISLTFEYSGVERLNNAQKAALNGKKLIGNYELALTVSGKPVTDFAGGVISLTIPMTPADGENGHHYAVWYVAEDGELERRPTSFADNALHFSTTHCSDYVVTYEPRPFSDVPENGWYYDAVYYCFDSSYYQGIGDNTFAPGNTMTRAMFATVLYRIAGEPKTDIQNPYTDVNAGEWYTDAVLWATSEKIIEGYGDGRFGTNDPVTREQMVTLLWRYSNSPSAETVVLSDFNDIDQISIWAAKAFEWAAAAGIVNGKGNGILDPKGTATRAEVAQIVANFGTKAR